MYREEVSQAADLNRCYIALATIAMVCLPLAGCAPDPPDADLTSRPEYSFVGLAGTLWKTKDRVAIADLSDGRYIVVPEHFDRADPHFDAPPRLRVIAVLPPGTRLRIRRLMESRGNASEIRATGALPDGPHASEELFLDFRLFEKNCWLFHDKSYPKTWRVNPDMLEK